jgi:hypothetical protein
MAPCMSMLEVHGFHFTLISSLKVPLKSMRVHGIQYMWKSCPKIPWKVH